MKVCAAVHKAVPFHGAGAEAMLHAILRDWTARGHECTVLFPDAPGPYRLDGITFGKTPTRHLEDVFRGTDLVVTHLDLTGPVVRAAGIATRPLIHLIHNDRQLQFHNVKPGPDVLVVPNSRWIDANVSSEYQRIICRPPVELDRYRVAAKDRKTRDRITLVNVTSAKGATTFYNLTQSEIGRNFLGVAGAYGIPTRPPRRYPNLELIGQTADPVRDIYARTRVVLMPSSYESWGRVAIEAAVSGIPTIASPTPGLLESLGDAGLFAEPADLKAWRRHLLELDDPDYYAERATLARRRAEELAHWIDGDLERLERAAVNLVEDHRRRLGAAYHPHDPMILDTITAGLKCPICGSGSCACGPTGDNILDGFQTVRDAPRFDPTPPTIYKTWRGDFRYNTAGAIHAGLIPDPASDTFPSPVARRLGDDLRRAMAAYAAAPPAARADFLTAVNTSTPRALIDNLEAILTKLEKSRGKRSASPAAEASSGLAAAGESGAGDAGTPPTEGRVGDILAWAGDDTTRLRAALRAEKTGRRRKSLITKLEALIAE